MRTIEDTSIAVAYLTKHKQRPEHGGITEVWNRNDDNTTIIQQAHGLTGSSGNPPQVQ